MFDEIDVTAFNNLTEEEQFNVVDKIITKTVNEHGSSNTKIGIPLPPEDECDEDDEPHLAYLTFEEVKANKELYALMVGGIVEALKDGDKDIFNTMVIDLDEYHETVNKMMTGEATEEEIKKAEMFRRAMQSDIGTSASMRLIKFIAGLSKVTQEVANKNIELRHLVSGINVLAIMTAMYSDSSMLVPYRETNLIQGFQIVEDLAQDAIKTYTDSLKEVPDDYTLVTVFLNAALMLCGDKQLVDHKTICRLMDIKLPDYFDGNDTDGDNPEV